MNDHFPYQVVAFLSDEPNINESAYNSPHGWYAQIALKRRFRLEGPAENELIARLQAFAGSTPPLKVVVGDLVKPDRMPVHVLEVENKNELMDFHLTLIKVLQPELISRYPERDGTNYLPHITAEYNGSFIIDVQKYKNRTYSLSRICLLKDGVGEDSLAHYYFNLGATPE